MHIPQTEVILRHDGAELSRVTVPPGEYVIGRAPEADLHIDTPHLSPRHARLTINYDQMLVEDLESANGTFVAEGRIEECTRLFPNQALRLGEVHVTIHRLPGPPEPDDSLAPAQLEIRRLVSHEVLAEERYLIGRQVARGGMGAVLQAKQNAMKRHVAMKVMLESGEPGDIARFVHEAQITGQLEHPNIVPVHELGIDEQGQLFYTMKFVRGITLKKVIELIVQGIPQTTKKYPLPALLTLFQKACDAVAFAHSKDVLHRDLKPDNIMVGDYGEVLVMDWGLAKVLGQTPAPAGSAKSVVMSARTERYDDSRTITGTVMGTPAYMPPEQARGEVESLDTRADIYSLGAILFEILHLHPPFSGDDQWAIVEKVKRGEIDWTRPKKPLPDSLLAVCRKALAFEREQRYGRVEDLQRDLEAYQNGFATSAEKAGPGKLLWLILKRHKTVSIATALVLYIGIAFGARAIFEGQRAEREAERAKAALAELKKTAPALHRLAVTDANAQRFDSALVHLDAALAIDPDLRAAYWCRGWAFLAQEKLPESIAALRLAIEKDPENKRLRALLPHVEKMAAAPPEKRHALEIVQPLYQHLTAVGAMGEAIPFIRHLKLGNAARLTLVRDHVSRWLGQPAGQGPKAPSPAVFLNGGLLTVRLSGLRLANLDPLRGLPIDELYLDDCGVVSLEPLRGMRLRLLSVSPSLIEDLGPLAGMPLDFLSLYLAPVKDLTPLRGLPLRTLTLTSCRGVTDLGPLAGLPLEDLKVNNCPVSDFSALRDMPLQKLNVADTSFADGRVLAGMPLAELTINNTPFTDLSTLVGLPLRSLILGGCKVKDYAPLLQIPTLETLAADTPLEKLLPLRQHTALKQIRANQSSHLPAPEFWAAYDRQAAQK